MAASEKQVMAIAIRSASFIAPRRPQNTDHEMATIRISGMMMLYT